MTRENLSQTSDGPRDVDVLVPAVEVIARGDAILAYVVRRASPTSTTFVTDPDAALQVGFVVYPAGGSIQRHVHVPVRRELTTTSEVLVVQQGACKVDFYDDERAFVASRTVAAGDVLVLLAGGHGFEMLEDTTLLEVKQGPYGGLDEKERF